MTRDTSEGKCVTINNSNHLISSSQYPTNTHDYLFILLSEYFLKTTRQALATDCIQLIHRPVTLLCTLFNSSSFSSSSSSHLSFFEHNALRVFYIIQLKGYYTIIFHKQMIQTIALKNWIFLFIMFYVNKRMENEWKKKKLITLRALN